MVARNALTKRWARQITSLLDGTVGAAHSTGMPAIMACFTVVAVAIGLPFLLKWIIDSAKNSVIVNWSTCQ